MYPSLAISHRYALQPKPIFKWSDGNNPPLAKLPDILFGELDYIKQVAISGSFCGHTNKLIQTRYISWGELCKTIDIIHFRWCFGFLWVLMLKLFAFIIFLGTDCPLKYVVAQVPFASENVDQNSLNYCEYIQVNPCSHYTLASGFNRWATRSYT